MNIWALSDLHLSFGVKNKEMDVFGEKWVRHHEKIKMHWESMVQKDDLMLIAGDISWALTLEEAIPDLAWIDQLPGTKVMIKGNHDLWWKSQSKVKSILPPSIHIIYNNAFNLGDITIGGARLWENASIDYSPYITFVDTPNVHVHLKENTEEEKRHDEKVFQNELSRLAWSLDAMKREAKLRIVMLHYPPTNPQHEENNVTRLLENEAIDYCIYGHIHNLKEGAPVDYTMGNVKYICTAADWLNFVPYKLATYELS